MPLRKEPAPEAFEVVAFNKTLPRQRRSRNPLYIPMRTADSPHIWAVNLKNDPVLLEALLKSERKKIKIRYEDPSMKLRFLLSLRTASNHKD